MKEVEEHTTWSRSIAKISKKGSEGSTLLAVLMKSYFFGANTQTIALQTLIRDTPGSKGPQFVERKHYSLDHFLALFFPEAKQGARQGTHRLLRRSWTRVLVAHQAPEETSWQIISVGVHHRRTARMRGRGRCSTRLKEIGSRSRTARFIQVCRKGLGFCITLKFLARQLLDTTTCKISSIK